MSIKVGTLIHNNDPRHPWTVPILEITEAPFGTDSDKYAVIKPRLNGRFVKVRLDRIYTDGYPRAQGYNVVEPKFEDEKLLQDPHPLQLTSGTDRAAQAHVEGRVESGTFYA